MRPSKLSINRVHQQLTKRHSLPLSPCLSFIFLPMKSEDWIKAEVSRFLSYWQGVGIQVCSAFSGHVSPMMHGVFALSPTF